METTINLYQKLWQASDDLRSQMDANEYKNYLLGIIFYKYLSDKMLDEVGKLLEVDDADLNEIQAMYEEEMQGDDADLIVDELRNKFSFVISPVHTFTNFIKQIEEGAFQLDDLGQAFNEIERADKDFNGLFEDIDLYSNKLGKLPQEKNKRISNVMKQFAEVNFANYSGDVLGDVYEYMLANFASESGKKAGEFYTPQPVSRLMAMIAMDGKEDKAGLTVFDPTLGSGSLLLNVRNFSNEANRIRYFGQELNNSTYNLSRMNMILHDVPLEYQSLNQGNTLSDDWPVDEPTNFDAVLMNPPYSAKWDASKGFLDDPRFSEYGVLPPKSRADFAFLLHGVYHLKNTGTMAILLPHGVLFRSGAEAKIRKIMLENGSIDAVIGLAPNLFYSTGIPVSLIILKKDKTDRSVYFIDASEEFVKKGNKNELTEDNIQKIYKALRSREEIDKFAHLAKFEEIEENGFNLNIPRYVDTFEEEDPIDLAEVSKDIKAINEEADKLKAEILADMKDLVANTDEAKAELAGFMEILGGNL
ncbi:type I restriction-modification system subunit M [Anaerococcus hydrogenalis]|uniref:type I restriction-modification system subunit M n=1 Tax=Anaerococcus hydrogenalis TaxID=33029 RepID=UPI002901B472|nr:type I restriction-modification system subunit M [Anaerococcus hydrogenalis]MDU1315817.1 type I restriction-modification system subunit M [Anaerococcus hydrogenalis]